MAIEVTIAGAYTSTYNSVAVGMTTNGFELQVDTHGEIVNETDIYGESVLDFVQRGSSYRLIAESKVFKAGSVTPFYPWGSLGVIATTAAPIGRIASDVAASMVLTVVSNTKAHNTTPSINTLTASKAILAPNSNLSLLFSSRVRNVPLNLMLLPSESGGTVTAFVPS